MPNKRIPLKLRAEVWTKSDGVCHYCGCELHPLLTFTVDHIVPTSMGGTDDLDNLVAACNKCNSGKRARTPAQWRPPTPLPLPIPGENDLDALALWLRAFMTRTGMNQDEIARAIGFHPSSVSFWVSGYHAKPIPQAYRALAVLAEEKGFPAPPERPKATRPKRGSRRKKNAGHAAA